VLEDDEVSLSANLASSAAVASTPAPHLSEPHETPATVRTLGNRVETTGIDLSTPSQHHLQHETGTTFDRSGQLDRTAQLERELSIEREMRLARELRLERELFQQREVRLQHEMREAVKAQQAADREPTGSAASPHSAWHVPQTPSARPLATTPRVEATPSQGQLSPAFSSSRPADPRTTQPPTGQPADTKSGSSQNAQVDSNRKAGSADSRLRTSAETVANFADGSAMRSAATQSTVLAASESTACFATDFYYPREPLLTGGVASIDSASIVVGPQTPLWSTVPNPQPLSSPSGSRVGTERSTGSQASPLQRRSANGTSHRESTRQTAFEADSTDSPVELADEVMQAPARSSRATTDPVNEHHARTASAAPATANRPAAASVLHQDVAASRQSAHQPVQRTTDERPTTTSSISHRVKEDRIGDLQAAALLEDEDSLQPIQISTRHPGKGQKPSSPVSAGDGASIERAHDQPTGETVPADTTATLTQTQSSSNRKAAAWEVDRFSWSRTVRNLYEKEAAYFRHAGKKLKDASREGLTRLAITASEPGEGCTTLAICLARAAAAAGARVALMDANLQKPELSELFGLDFANSWHEALDGKSPLSEASVVSLADELTLIPLAFNPKQTPLSLDDPRLVRLLSEARDAFDLILIDLGVSLTGLIEPSVSDQPCGFDAAIVVRDVRRVSEQRTLETVAKLKNRGIDAVGIAENFRTPT
jgi:Mrp family chromosome partitioning ATPase